MRFLRAVLKFSFLEAGLLGDPLVLLFGDWLSRELKSKPCPSGHSLPCLQCDLNVNGVVDLLLFGVGDSLGAEAALQMLSASESLRFLWNVSFSITTMLEMFLSFRSCGQTTSKWNFLFFIVHGRRGDALQGSCVGGTRPLIKNIPTLWSERKPDDFEVHQRSNSNGSNGQRCGNRQRLLKKIRASQISFKAYDLLLSACLLTQGIFPYWRYERSSNHTSVDEIGNFDS